MDILRQFGIILALAFVGEILHALLPLPIPASIYGILLLFAMLRFKVLHVVQIRETVTFLIETMPIMFVPAAAGLLFDRLRGRDLLLMALTGAVLYREQRGRMRGEARCWRGGV